jgi:hypothetical protein
LVPTITDRFDAELLNAAPFRTCVIANFGAGIEHIDLDAARRANIVVTNTPGALDEATAEIALLLMLMASRRAGRGRSGSCGPVYGADGRPLNYSGRTFAGKRSGLIGFRSHRPRDCAPRARLTRRARGLSFPLARIGRGRGMRSARPITIRSRRYSRRLTSSRCTARAAQRRAIC